MPPRNKLVIALTAASAAITSLALADDSIVQGNMCVGMDCAAVESFGTDTLRLKTDVTRLKFEDTSTGAFPGTDWQLTANDAAAGGANKFSIEDVTAATVPFTISGAAPNNALFVANSGHVGLGTASPARELHIVSNDTPTLRFDQTNLAGWPAQNWELAGNEANFFIRDANPNVLVFRLRGGAPSNSLYVHTNGDVGLGTGSPSAFLHVVRSNATGLDPFTSGGVRIETTPATPATTLGLVVTNNGPIANAFADNDGKQLWYETYGAKLPSGERAFQISEASTPGVAFSLQGNGNLTLGGVLSEGSSRTFKHNLERVNPQQMLEHVARLGIHRWQYKHDGAQSKHVGPMAEDFHAAFGLGPDDKHLASIDVSGVALAAIQALHSENLALKSDNAELKARLERLESLVSRLAAAPAR